MGVVTNIVVCTSAILTRCFLLSPRGDGLSSESETLSLSQLNILDSQKFLYIQKRREVRRYLWRVVGYLEKGHKRNMVM